MSDAAAVAAPAAPPVAETPTTNSDATKPAAGAVAAPPATPAAPEYPKTIKLKGKVGDQELEEEIPYDKLVAQWQKMKAADRRLEEASSLQKRVQAALERAKENPFDPELKEALGGVDLRERAIAKLYEEWQAEQLKQQDPKEFEKQQLQKELEAERAKGKQREEADKARAFAEQVEVAKQEIVQTYSAAMKATGLPMSEEVFLKMVEIGDWNLAHGVSLSAEQLAAETKEFFEGYDKRADERSRSRRSGLKGEDLLKDLGDELVREVQNTLLARARSNRQRPVQAQQPVQQTQPETSKKESDTDVMKRLGVPLGF
jgi:hypothetical protein